MFWTKLFLEPFLDKSGRVKFKHLHLRTNSLQIFNETPLTSLANIRKEDIYSHSNLTNSYKEKCNFNMTFKLETSKLMPKTQCEHEGQCEAPNVQEVCTVCQPAG